MAAAALSSSLRRCAMGTARARSLPAAARTMMTDTVSNLSDDQLEVCED